MLRASTTQPDQFQHETSQEITCRVCFIKSAKSVKKVQKERIKVLVYN